MEEDLRSRLTGDGSIVAAGVKSGSIAWGDRPQASGLPAITLDYINDGRDQHMTGFQALRGSQVQVDVWSNDRLQARNIRELVVAGIVPSADVGETSFRRSFIDSMSSGFERLDSGIVVYRERIDLTIWHAPAS